jgi:hypothetical protein
MSSFIPYFHFDHPSEKMKPSWARKVIDHHFYNKRNLSLLDGKNVGEIDQFASGDIDMRPFKRMFKSMRKKMLAQEQGTMNKQLPSWAQDINTVGVEFAPLAIIPIKLNSAANNIYRIPADVTCTAQDSLAMKKKKEDINFLKNKPAIEADLQEVADQLGVGKVDIGTTKHASINFSDAPMGMDLNNPQHEELFSRLFYSLKVTTAIEKALKQFNTLKKSDQIRLLNIQDHLKYGIAVHRGYESSMTGLPDLDYIDPSMVYTPYSQLPDYSDNTHRYVDMEMTVMEMFNYFSNEICDEETLEKIMNEPGKGNGYCACNGYKGISKINWDSFKVNIKYFEVKSIDWVGVKTNHKSKRKTTTFTMDEKQCESKIWGQNTYGFYWLHNTNYFFGIHRLAGSHRTRGQESMQNFSTNIYRSQKKSAVELSIVENKKAQIAEIKLEHTIIKSLPPGRYIDLKYLRSALEGLVEEGNKYTMDDLLSMAFEHNLMIGDSEGFDGKNDGQLKPFIDMPGGLKDEARGYIAVIMQASANIASITGINEQFTGQSAEDLVGLQQLRINSGLNAIDYCVQGIQQQFEALNNTWALYIQNAVEDGGKTKQAIVNMIGQEDADLLDSLDEAPLHDLTIKVDIGSRMYEQQQFQRQVDLLDAKGILTSTDKYLLDAVDNPKEKFKTLYFIEERFRTEQERARQEQYAAAQQLQQTKTQGDVAVTAQKGQQKKEEIYAQGDVDQKLMSLGNQLGLSTQQMDGLIKRALQKDRNEGQTQKQLRALQEKYNLENQKAYL